MKLKWKVSTPATGRYRSFQQRAWPSAYVGDQLMFALSCADEYRPADAKSGCHAELKVYVYDYSLGKRERKMGVLKARFTTLAAAKAGAEDFLARHPEMLPKEETNGN